MTKQVNREYQIKEVQTLGPLFIQVHNLIVAFPKTSFTHIPREENKEADATGQQCHGYSTLILMSKFAIVIGAFITGIWWRSFFDFGYSFTILVLLLALVCYKVRQEIYSWLNYLCSGYNVVWH